MSGPEGLSRPEAPLAWTILHPVLLASIVVLVVNDRLLKARWPSVLTGKLSDVAGLVFFPLVLVSICEGFGWVFARGPRRASTSQLVACTFATAVAFAAVKASARVASGYSTLLGWLQWPARAVFSVAQSAEIPHPVPVLVRADLTDLVALPAVLTSLLVTMASGRVRRP
jgi:hypothetical protein